MKYKISLIFILLTTFACARPQLVPNKPERAAWIIAAGSDVITSEQCFSRLDYCKEKNPLIAGVFGDKPNTAELITVKGLTYYLTALTEASVRVNGKKPPWWLRIILWVPATILQALVAYHNSNIGR